MSNKLDVDVATTTQAKQPSKRLIDSCRATLRRKEILNALVPISGAADVLMKPESISAYTDGALSADVLKELRRQKRGPAYFRVGHRTVIYRRSDVDKYLDARKVETNKDILNELAKLNPQEIEEMRKEMIRMLMKGCLKRYLQEGSQA